MSALGVALAPAGVGQWRRSWRRFARNRLALLSLAVILVLLALALLAPLVSPHSPTSVRLAQRLQPPSAAFWLGTDERGRDLLTRLLHGGRTTFLVVGATLAAIVPVGLVVGLAAAWFRGIVETVLLRAIDIFLSFPSLILALAFAAGLGPGLFNAVLAIAVASWPSLARLVYAEAIRVRGSDFVTAAWMQGASTMRILFRYLLPCCIPVLLVRATLGISSIILTAASLGFLGLGVQPPTAEWGAMLAGARGYMFDHPWLVVWPGLAIVVLAVAFNLVGDGLRDMLDPSQP